MKTILKTCQEGLEFIKAQTEDFNMAVLDLEESEDFELMAAKVVTQEDGTALIKYELFASYYEQEVVAESFDKAKEQIMAQLNEFMQD